MKIIYNIVIQLYTLGIKVSGLFHEKARLWVKGRKGLFEKLEKIPFHQEKIAWFHCASLGEFEQGRPVIERFRQQYPDFKILLTFFSPSGYEIRKNTPLGDYIFYLPADTSANAKRFIKLVKPKMVFFIKYELWFNYFRELKKTGVPIFLISGIFRPSQYFFKPWGGYFLKELKHISHFFVQNTQSRKLLLSKGITQVTVSGDTRFDRVSAVMNKPTSFHEVEKFIQASIIIIAGSTWPADEKLLVELIKKDYKGIKYIIAPHEISAGHIKQLETEIGEGAVRLSDPDTSRFAGARVLIVDSIGKLTHLYQYASLAYIGGGFGAGIHNVLEAAVFGMPVIFGPNYQKFQEANDLIKFGSGFCVHDSQQLIDTSYLLLSNYDLLRKTSQISKEYVKLKTGATQTIFNHLGLIFPNYTAKEDIIKPFVLN